MYNIFYFILGYLGIGIFMAMWDFRKSLFRRNESGTFLEQPRFLQNFAVSTALIFVFTWPYKLLKK